jgi:hypothetical protein
LRGKELIRLITHFHKQEKILDAACKPAGRLIVWLCAVSLLMWHEVPFLMMLAYSLVILFPARRRVLASTVSALLLVQVLLTLKEVELAWTLLDYGFLFWAKIFATAAVVLAGLWVVVAIARHFSRLPAFIQRFPLVCLHTAMWAALILSTLPGLAVLQMANSVVWRMSYLFLQAKQGKVANTRFSDHLFYLEPVYGGHPTPHGKGLQYLSRTESRDDRTFTQSQLAGIKLLILSIIWIAVKRSIEVLVFGQENPLLTAWTGGWSLDWPIFDKMIGTPGEQPLPQVWASLYLELIVTTLNMAIYGHIIIGCLRLLGFNVFRNTYKPLLSESIVDFWHRYNHYFKELLVEFFFYPVFLRARRLGPNIRMLLAVFAAAFAGNMYFHILLEPQLVTELDLDELWLKWGPRFTYCYFLALGIWLSMLRQKTRRSSQGERGWFVRLRAIAGVWTFYSMIRIWNIRTPEVDSSERWQFFLSLFGL